MTTTTLLTPVSITATGGGPDIDVSRLTGPVRVTLASRNTAGTSPTLATKLQTSTGIARGAEQQTAGTTDNKLREGATTNVELGLAFTQDGTRSIKRVALQLKNPGTITAGKLITLRIESDTAGSPSGTILANGTAATVLCSAVPVAYGWVVFTFAKPVDLVDESVYHHVLSGDYTASATNCIYWRSLTVADGGTVETFDDTSWAAVTTTEAFEYYSDVYTFADLTSGGFTTLSTALNTTVQTLEFHGPNLPKIMRAHFTIGGTSSPAFSTSAVVNADPAQE